MAAKAQIPDDCLSQAPSPTPHFSASAPGRLTALSTHVIRSPLPHLPSALDGWPLEWAEPEREPTAQLASDSDWEEWKWLPRRGGDLSRSPSQATGPQASEWKE